MLVTVGDEEGVWNIESDKEISHIEARLKARLVRILLAILLKGNIETLFLPANRSFYPAFYQYIYEIERNRLQKLLDLVRVSGQPALESFRVPYTQPVNELISKLYQLNRERKASGHYTSLLQKLQQLMGGSVQIKSAQEVAIIDFSFKVNNQQAGIPLYVSSSSVNQLTLLALYFEYWAKEKNNFLIIDEPEENLNPKNQIQLLEILLLFAGINNNKVLITTHSPLMAEAVNTYCYLHHLKQRLHYDPTALADEEDLMLIDPHVSFDKNALAVYYFNGKAIIDYNSEDYGILFRDFKQTTNIVDKNNKVLSDYIYLAEHQANAQEIPHQ